MRFNLTLKSQNVKLGEIATSMSSMDTCPKSCFFYKRGCYAKYGPMSWTWTNLSNHKKIGMGFSDFIRSLRQLPQKTLFRHNQCGDLVGVGERINVKKLNSLVKAVKHLKAWTYTHKNVLTDKANRLAVKEANKEGFVINLSANNPSHADELANLKIAPVVTVLPLNAPSVSYTPQGRKIVVCPAQQKENVTCQSCQLCLKKNRSCIVGFRIHGNDKNKIDI